MPTPKKYRITEAVITVQWKGYWEPTNYDPANTNAFPGIQVPATLANVAASLQGEEVLIDLAKGKWDELRKAIELLFDYKTIGKGPASGVDWVLVPSGQATTSGHIRWVPSTNANGLAYAVGRKTGGPAHVEEYKFSDVNIGRANFWLFFLLYEIP